jgi:predicted enzyme related to lactoylglutathione lyase
MYISVVTLFVENVDRAIDFYTNKLGWEKTMDEEMGDDRWVTVAPKGAQTSFTLSTGRGENRVPGKPGGETGVILEVDDVNKTYAALSKLNIEFPEQPQAMPWGGWAMFKDSEGNVLGLHSPVAAAVSKN